ncbi:MAG: tol-pal system protein YbgF [Calditrichaeota bacterium]|nr:MAG: tol-pal system protein YbgF [Calditrichota bacterium]
MKFYTQLFILMMFSLVLWQCAGSSDQNDEEGGYSEEEQQQKELDDIEALLGISSDDNGGQNQAQQDDTAAEEPQKKQAEEEKPAARTQNEDEGEKLNLLDTNESIPAGQMSGMSAAEKKKYEKEIKKLKKQLKEKDNTIANLSAELSVKEDELSKKSNSPSYGGVSGGVGAISMEEYSSRYEEARNAFENRNYQQAIELFESLLATSSSHPLADNAQYWIGESQFMLHRYDAAIISFEKVFTFPKSNKNADAQYKLGLCYVMKGDKTKAREEFERLIADYPNSRYVALARKKMAAL